LEFITECLEDYRYAKVTSDIISSYGELAVKAQAISRLLISLELYPSNMMVFVDGEANNNGIVKDILNIFNENQKNGILERRRLQFIVQGDQVIPLVNKADMLAYKIFYELERNRNYSIEGKEINIPVW